MSLRIRLARGGAKKRPFYRIVVADSRMPRDGRFIEKLGFYNPMVPKDHPDRLRVDEDRVKHWIGVGALPSDRVARFLSDRGLVEKPVIREQTKQDKPKAKTLERMEAAAEKATQQEPKAKEEAAAAEEAAQQESAVEEAAPEAPAEEAAQEQPAEEAAQEQPAQEAAPEETAAEETAPAEEAPAEEAAAEEAPAEDSAEEAKKED